MKKLIFKLRAFWAFGSWASKNSKLADARNFKLMSGLLEMMFKVAKDHKPYMAHIGMVSLDEKFPIVNIWAGPGVQASPYERIRELIEENEALRKSLANEIVEKEHGKV